MADDTFTCSLDDQSVLKAKRELHEDPKERLSAVNTLRDWIHQRNWLKTPTGIVIIQYI